MFNRTASPGWRSLAVLALVAVVVLTAASALAETKRKTVKFNPAPTAQTIAKDEVGNHRAPTAEEAAVLAEGLKKEAEGKGSLTVYTFDDGSSAAELDESFDTSTVAVRNADGSQTMGCVTNATEAKQFVKNATKKAEVK